jgi:hypothetical protein
VDLINFGLITNGRSYGRYPDGQNTWGKAFYSKDHKNNNLLGAATLFNQIDSNNTAKPAQKITEKKTEINPLIDSLTINEVYYIQTNDILNKDLWLEIENISSKELNIDSLSISTDAAFGKQFVFTKNLEARSQKIIQPNEIILIYLSQKQDEYKQSYSISLSQKSNLVAIYYGQDLIDSVAVPVLDRDESFARLPDGYGDFRQVKYETPNHPNNQVIPGKYSKPKVSFLHNLGFAVSNYQIKNSNFKNMPRGGACMGFSLEHSLLYFNLRHSLMYKRQGFRVQYDSTLTTSFGKIETKTQGYQRMEYFGWSTEMGLPLTPKFELFYGIDFDIRLNNTSDLVTTQIVTLTTGEELSNTATQTDDYAINPDNIDLNLSLAVEYRINKNMRLNASVRRDFGGLSILSNAYGIRGQRIFTNVFQLKFIVPLYQNDRLTHASYLLDTR